MSDEQYRTGRRNFLRTGAAIGGAALAGCVTTRFPSSGEQDGLEYRGNHYTLEREQSRELHVSNDEFGPFAAYLAAGEDYLVEISVDKWNRDEVRVDYDLLRVGDESLEGVESARTWLGEREEPSYPSTLFEEELPETAGIELTAIDWDNGLGNDHDAYFTPAGEDPFEQVHLKRV